MSIIRKIRTEPAIGCPREMVWIIDLEVVPAGVFVVTVTTDQER